MSNMVQDKVVVVTGAGVVRDMAASHRATLTLSFPIRTKMRREPKTQ